MCIGIGIYVHGMYTCIARARFLGRHALQDEPTSLNSGNPRFPSKGSLKGDVDIDICQTRDI